MNNVTGASPAAATRATQATSDPAPATVSLSDVARLLVELGMTMNTVITTIAETLKATNDRLNRLSNLYTQISTLNSSIKNTDGSKADGHADLNDPETLKQVQAIADGMRELVDPSMETPSGNAVTKSFLDDWAKTVQSNQDQIQTIARQDASRSDMATKNQGAATENASSVIKTLFQSLQTIVQPR
jgi:hypothetical protein